MKKFVIFTIVLFVAEFSFANPIKMRKAKEKARTFIQQKHIGLTPLKLAYSPDGEKEDAPLFVFNVGDKKGFVVVAGNGEDEEIMGYADEGEFDYAALPENLKAWIDGVAGSARMPGMASVRAVQHPTTVIEPLLTTKWGQRAPFNSACPVLSGDTEKIGSQIFHHTTRRRTKQTQETSTIRPQPAVTARRKPNAAERPWTSLPCSVPPSTAQQ